ncbi:uncharacterized protein [Haliotis asinina]|uniref:uncharacterized protein n=1 Tax=Haliotis asinina TaxID=109174 RepID=UPI0035326BD6
MTEEDGKGLIATEKTFEELAREYLGDTVGSGADDVDLDDLAAKYLTDFDATPVSYSSDCHKAMSEEPVSSSDPKEDAAVTLVLPTALDSPNKRKSPGSPSSSESKQRKTEILVMKDGTKEKISARVSPTTTSNSDAAPETTGTTSLTQEGDKDEMARQVGKTSLSGRTQSKEPHSGGPRCSNDSRNQKNKYSRDAASRYTKSGQIEQGRRGLLGHCPPSHNVMARMENQNRNGPRLTSHDQNISRWNDDRLPFDDSCKGGPLGDKREYIGRIESNFEHPFHDKFGNSVRRKPLYRNENVPSDLFRRDGLLDPPLQPPLNRDENSRRNGLLDPPSQPSLSRDENSWRNGLLDPPSQPSFSRDENSLRDGLLDPPQNPFSADENFRRNGLLDPPQSSFSRDENIRRDGLLDPPQPSLKRDENIRRVDPQAYFIRDDMCRRNGPVDHPQQPFDRGENYQRDGLLDPPQESLNRNENYRRGPLLNPPQLPFNRDENFRRDHLLDPSKPSFNREENFGRDGLLDHPQEFLNRNDSFRRDALLNRPQPPFNRDETFCSDARESFNRDENFRRNHLLEHPKLPFKRDENFQRDGLLDLPQPPCNGDEHWRRDSLLDPPQESLNRNENFRREGLLDPQQPPFHRDENFRRDALLAPPRELLNRLENFRRDAPLDHRQPLSDRDKHIQRGGLLHHSQQLFISGKNFRRDGLVDPPQESFNRDENVRKDGLLDPPPPPFNRDEKVRRDGLLEAPQPPFSRDETIRRDGLLDLPQRPFNRDDNVRRDGLLDPPQLPFNKDVNIRRDGLLDPPQPPFNRDENVRRDGLLDPPQPLFNRDENVRRDGLLDPPQPPFNRDENVRRDGLLDPPPPPFNRDENVRRDGLLEAPQPPFNRDQSVRRDGLLDPPQPPFNRDENIQRDGLLDPPQPPFNRDKSVRRDGLLDPPQPQFNRDENIRRDGLLDPSQPPFSRNENFQRDGLLDPPQPPFSIDQNFHRDGLLDLPLNKDENIMRDGLLDHTQPPFNRDDNVKRGGLLDPPHPSVSLDENMQPHLVANTLYQTFPWGDNMQAMLLNRDQLNTPCPPLTFNENDRRHAQLDPQQPTLRKGGSQKEGLLPPPLPVFSGNEPTPNRRGLLDPPNVMTLGSDISQFDNRRDGSGHMACRAHAKPPLPRGEHGNAGQSVNQGPQPEHVIESPTASFSVQARQRDDARKPRVFRRGVSVHEFVTKVVLTTFSTTRSATLTAGKYSVPVSCKSAVPPEINFELLKKLPRSIQEANTVLIDCQQWLARGMAPLITQVNMFGKEPQTSAEVCRRTTDSLRILACTCVNISKGRRLLMKCHLPEKYGVLCRMSNSITSSLFGDKVDEDIRSIQMGTSKIKMLNGPNEETHIPKVKTDLLCDENIDENVASMVNLACTKEGIVKDLREKYKIPSNLNCMIPPKLNPEISSMLPVTCLDLDTKLQDVHLTTSEAMVPGVYLLERIHEKMYNDSEAVKMLTDALALLGDAMFQYNNLRMELLKGNLPLKLEQECVWSCTEDESVVPDSKK